MSSTASRRDDVFSGVVVDADPGVWGCLKSNYPILGGITPTAGGVVFVGDIGGTSIPSMLPSARSFG